MGTMCTCEEIERGTHACRASKLGPVERWWTQDGKLRITTQDPPRVRKTDTFIVFLLIHIILYHVSKNLLIRCLFYVTIKMYFYSFSMSTLHVTFVTVVFIFAKYLSLYLHIFHMHTHRHIHTRPHVQSAHKRNNDSRAQGPG